MSHSQHSVSALSSDRTLHKHSTISTTSVSTHYQDVAVKKSTIQTTGNQSRYFVPSAESEYASVPNAWKLITRFLGLRAKGNTRQLQRVRADSLAGKSESSKYGEHIMENLHTVGEISDEDDSDQDENFYGEATVRELNEAFLKDIESFEVKPEQDDPDSTESFVDLVTPDKADKSGKGNKLLEHLQDPRRYVDVRIKRTKADRMKTRDDRRGTVYNNYYTEQHVSPARLYLDRFFSDSKVAPVSAAQPSAPPDEVWDTEPIIDEELYDVYVRREITKAFINIENGPEEELRPYNLKEKVNPDYNGIDTYEWDEEFPSVLAERKPLPVGAKPDDYLYGKDAYDHYLRYKDFERDILDQKLAEDKFLLKQQLREKKEEIEAALMEAKTYYCSKHGIQPTLRRRLTIVKTPDPSSSEAGGQVPLYTSGIRNQLETLTTYMPFFIYGMTIIQLVVVIGQMGLAGVTTVSFTPKHKVGIHDDWAGYVEVSHEMSHNVWLGPSQLKLIQLGAVFAPCLRTDKLIGIRNAKYQDSSQAVLGCCEVPGVGAGTTTEQECADLMAKYEIISYLWRNVSCMNRDLKASSQGFEAHKFRPCSYGILGHCTLMTHSRCKFIDGLWFSGGNEHCSLIHSDFRICELLDLNKPYIEAGTIAMDKDVMSREHSHSQLWRIPLSLLYHNGVVHFLLVAFIQCYMGLDVERVVGWLRIASVYVVSGLGSLLIGSIFRPYEANVGAHGSALGLVGMNYVELLQAWRLITKPWHALGKLVLLTGVMLLAGFLPQMNQLTQLSGLVLGAMMAIICLPYVTFEGWHKHARIFLVLTFSMIIFVLLTLAAFIYFVVQPIGLGSSNSPGCVLESNCKSTVTALDLL